MPNKTDYSIRKHPQREHDQINSALTVGEVADGWNKHRKTVILAINTGRLCARRAGDVWIISFASAQALWGKPEEFPEFLAIKERD